jgi:hypothetical protein
MLLTTLPKLLALLGLFIAVVKVISLPCIIVVEKGLLIC